MARLMARVLISDAARCRSRWGNDVQFACATTLFEHGAGDGNRTRTVSLGRVLILPCFRVPQRYWRPQLAPGDPYRPGLVARAWPVLVLRVVRTSHWRKLPSRASPRRNRVCHYRGIRGDVPCRFRRRRPALGTNGGGSRTGTAGPMGRPFRPVRRGTKRDRHASGLSGRNRPDVWGRATRPLVAFGPRWGDSGHGEPLGDGQPGALWWT